MTVLCAPPAAAFAGRATKAAALRRSADDNAPTTLALAWVGAGAGIAMSLAWIEASCWLTGGTYLTLGWVAALAAPQLVTALQLTPLLLITGSGVLYSSGALVYALQRPDPWPRTFGFHEIFHALVILAAVLYYVAVVGWMLPRHG